MAAKTGFEQTQKMEQTQRQVALPSTILVGQMLEKSFEEVLDKVKLGMTIKVSTGAVILSQE